MRILGIVLSMFVFFLFTSTVCADDCSRVCQTDKELCDSTKGSWCNQSTHCQNIFVLCNGRLCFYSDSDKCLGGTPLKCTQVDDKLEKHIKAKESARLLEEINQRALRARGARTVPVRYAPDYEPDRFWGDGGCTIF
jgi:hypothetical protein